MAIYLSDPNESNHRSYVIVLACRIEGYLESILNNYFKNIYNSCSIERSYSFEKLDKDLFSFNTGIMGGIFKANKTCLYLDLIEYEVSHDIDKLIKIRNEYAHKLESRQLSEDGDLFKHIENTFFYKRDRSSLLELSKQDILNAYENHLINKLEGYLS